MSKEIKLNSESWCDLVFENKNKNYGAYSLRQHSSDRHILAFLITLCILSLVAVLPTVIDAIQDRIEARKAGRNTDEVFEMSTVEAAQEIPEENKIVQESAPPPPPLKSTIQFVPPVIAADDEVADDKMKTVEEVFDSREQISIADIIGDDDNANAIDIAELQEQKVIVEAVKEEPFITVEQMPGFPGGEAEMNKFINDNLKYPIVALEQGIQGRVTIRFVVTKDGNISDVTVLRGIDPACDKEAVRVVKLMPKWTAGRQNGKAVPVYFTLPIVYRLK